MFRMPIEKFIEMSSDIKDIELHLTVGDVLVFYALGHLSPAAAVECTRRRMRPPQRSSRFGRRSGTRALLPAARAG